MNEIRVQIWGVPSMGSHRVGHDWSDLAAAAARWWNATFPMQTFKRERHFFVNHRGALLVAQMVKNPPAMWETWAWSLGWEDPLKEGMTTHSSILAWRISMDRGACRLQSMGVTKSQTREGLSMAQRVKLYSFHSQLVCGVCTVHRYSGAGTLVTYSESKKQSQ